MTLDEAIKHAEEVADKKEREKQKWEKMLEIDCNYRAIITEKVSCELCAEEHRQLAEWLKDYKQLKEQQPCDDAISREDTLKAIIKNPGIRSKEYLLEAEKAVYKTVENMPPVTPQKYGEMRICPSCGLDVHSDFKYCPRCGRKMQESEEV